MKAYSITETNKLYMHMKHCKMYKQTVHHETLQKLCDEIQDLGNGLGELAQDEFWQELLLELRKLRFILCAAPIPINFQLGNIIKLLKNNKRKCRLSFPSFIPQLQTIIDNAIELLLT